MDLISQSSAENGAVLQQKPVYVAAVDPFLVEALQNPRHRLTVLRMELDIQKFLHNPNTHQFEFPHFPTSYLRLAAHRVAQHYGLQTMVQDNTLEGQGIHILVTKKPESKFPSVSLSDVPSKELENDKLDRIKIVLKPRPKASSNDANGLGLKRSPVRTVEERKEEYDIARARIFNGYSNSELEEINMSVVEDEGSRSLDVDEDRSVYTREIGNTSRVAILRDREKDSTDPDYDRSYDRYVKNIPNSQSFNLAPINMQKFQSPFVQYDSIFPHQASFNYMSPYCAMRLDQTSRDALYMQWPSHSMLYAQSYDQLRQSFFQAPFCQQPLSFDYSQNHHR